MKKLKENIMRHKTKLIVVVVLAAAGLFILQWNNTGNSTEANNKNAVQGKTSNSESKVEYLTDKTFKSKVFNYEQNEEWVYEGSEPAIIEFYADWCGPCKKMAPVLDKLSKQYDDKVKIYKVDVDKERELSAAFGVRSIPTFLFIPSEGQPSMAPGALGEQGLVDVIENDLLK